MMEGNEFYRVFTVCYHTGHNREGSNGLDQKQVVPRVQSYNGNAVYNMTITEVYNKVTKYSSQCTSIIQTPQTIESMESPQAAQTIPTNNSACLENQVMY